MLFNKKRLFDKKQQLSTASAIALIFFKYVENDISAFLHLEPRVSVHISWNREASRNQHIMQNQKHRAWHFIMGTRIASLAITIFPE